VRSKSISWVGFSNVDYAIIGARLGALQTGLYFRAYTLAVEYQSKLGIVMGQVGFPVLSRTSSAAELAHLHRQMVRLLTIVVFRCWPFCAALSVDPARLLPRGVAQPALDPSAHPAGRLRRRDANRHIAAAQRHMAAARRHLAAARIRFSD
jgi:Polysaccharide biosynthesis protein